MIPAVQDKAQVLLIKQKLDDSKFPNPSYAWIDELTRGLLSQSTYYLNKKNIDRQCDLLAFVPKDSLFSQILILGEGNLPPRSRFDAFFPDKAHYFYAGDFSEIDVHVLQEYFTHIQEWSEFRG